MIRKDQSPTDTTDGTVAGHVNWIGSKQCTDEFSRYIAATYNDGHTTVLLFCDNVYCSVTD